MIHRMLNSLREIYKEEIISFMAERYVDAGRATPMTALRLGETEYKYASDEDIIEVLEELGHLATAEF